MQIPCCLDSQFSGMVEAWASGLTWREIMMDCAMDEGDLARLLRRTIDILAQVQYSIHLLISLILTQAIWQLNIFYSSLSFWLNPWCCLSHPLLSMPDSQIAWYWPIAAKQRNDRIQCDGPPSNKWAGWMKL